MTDNLIDQVRETLDGYNRAELAIHKQQYAVQFAALGVPMARHILATEERLRAAEALAELAKRHRHMTNCAFAAGTEEREGGSANRQGKCIDQYEAWHKQMEDALAAFKATEAGE
jgi:hypothetical protein